MNYEQALHKKELIGSSSFTLDEIDFKVFVTPGNMGDFVRYLGEIRSYFSYLTDSDALLYSRDGTYAVYALAYDGINVVYKPY